MNSHVSISYEQQLKATQKARRAKWAAKAAKVAQDNEARPVDRVEGVEASSSSLKPKVIVARFDKEQAREASRREQMAWRAMMGLERRPPQYFEGLCWLAGFSPDVIRSKTQRKPIAKARRSIIRSLAWAFPKMSSTQIGLLVNRDHTGVLFCLGATHKYRNSLPPVRKTNTYRRKLTREQVLELRQRAIAGEDRGALAAEFGVSKTTVWQIRHGDTHKGVT